MFENVTWCSLPFTNMRNKESRQRCTKTSDVSHIPEYWWYKLRLLFMPGCVVMKIGDWRRRKRGDIKWCRKTSDSTLGIILVWRVFLTQIWENWKRSKLMRGKVGENLKAKKSFSLRFPLSRRAWCFKVWAVKGKYPAQRGTFVFSVLLPLAPA